MRTGEADHLERAHERAPEAAPDPPHGWRESIGLGSLVSALALAGVYASVLVSTYGFTDDFHVLLAATRNNTELLTIDAAGGRPLTGILHEVTLSLATDVSSLRWVRLFGLLGVLVSAAIVWAIGRRMGLGQVGATALAIASGCVPGVQMLVAWAVMAPAAWSLALGVGAVLFHQFARRPDGSLDWRLLAVSLACSTGAWSLYQPTALVVVPGVVATGLALQLKPFIRHLVSGAIVVAFSGAVYLVTFTISQRLVESSVEDRAEATSDVLGKLRWFFDDVLVRALQPWDLTPSRTTGLVLLATLLVAVAFAERDTPPVLRALRALAVLFSLPAAYASGIYVAEQWPSARGRVGLEVGIVLIVGAVCASCRGRLPTHRSARAAAAAGGVLASTLLAFNASYTVASMITEPQAIEYRLSAALIRAADIEPGSTVVVRAASYADTLAREVVLDEFGMPSAAQPWVPPALVRLEVLEQKGFLVESITVLGPDDPIPPARPGTVVLDFRDLLSGL